MVRLICASDGVVKVQPPAEPCVQGWKTVMHSGNLLSLAARAREWNNIIMKIISHRSDDIWSDENKNDAALLNKEQVSVVVGGQEVVARLAVVVTDINR